jgi:hypothetical protein
MARVLQLATGPLRNGIHTIILRGRHFMLPEECVIPVTRCAD